MKTTTLAVAAGTILAFAQTAQAHEHHYRHHRHLQGDSGFTEQYWQQPSASSELAAHHGGLGPRPAAWCGWQMRQLVGGDPGPAYNLARNWAHWGHAGPAGIGAVVVWPHHVGKIVGQQNGQWVIESGNDGHALRTRPRSIAGAIAFRWS